MNTVNVSEQYSTENKLSGTQSAFSSHVYL